MTEPAVVHARTTWEGAGGAPAPARRAGVPERSEAGITGSWWRWARPLVGAAVLAVLVHRLGAGTFLDAVQVVDPRSLALGAAVALGTTACAAWRWRLVARRLRVDVGMPAAVASCYRSQFLNATLPGGVLGDVERGVCHGRDVQDVGRGLRTVGWERAAGQVVLVALTGGALLAARPFGIPAQAVTGVILGGVAGVVLAVTMTRSRPPRRSRLALVAREDLGALLELRTSSGILVASVAVVGGHLATFVLAARTAGVGMPVVDLVPLALVVLLVSAVPLNLAGWGPREGAAAWVFGAVGAGAAQGVATSVAYGTIVFVAALPGAVLLLGRRRRSVISTSDPQPRPALPPPVPVTVATVGGAVRG